VATKGVGRGSDDWVDVEDIHRMQFPPVEEKILARTDYRIPASRAVSVARNQGSLALGYLVRTSLGSDPGF